MEMTWYASTTRSGLPIGNGSNTLPQQQTVFCAIIFEGTCKPIRLGNHILPKMHIEKLTDVSNECVVPSLRGDGMDPASFPRRFDFSKRAHLKIDNRHIL